jgi:type II secretory pathway pseudopilin PulG
MYTTGNSADPHAPMPARLLLPMRKAREIQVWARFRMLKQAVLTLFQRTTRRIAMDSRGNLLLETLVAITVFALVGGAVLSGMSTALDTGSMVEGQSVAEEIARNQMESVFNVSYQEPMSTPYPTIVPPAGYAINLTADEYLTGDVDIEMVVVTVSRDSENILVLETLRTRWD